jgi:hypothetical protein
LILLFIKSAKYATISRKYLREVKETLIPDDKLAEYKESQWYE